MDYEIYEGLNRFNKKKTYLVFKDLSLSLYEMQKQANKFFKRSKNNVLLDAGYILDDELYLLRTKRSKVPEGSQIVAVAYFV